MRHRQSRGPGALTTLALLGGALWLARRYRHEMRDAVQAGMDRRQPQARSGAAFAHDDGPVRQAGREEMRDPPRR